MRTPKIEATVDGEAWMTVQTELEARAGVELLAQAKEALEDLCRAYDELSDSHHEGGTAVWWQRQKLAMALWDEVNETLKVAMAAEKADAED